MNLRSIIFGTPDEFDAGYAGEPVAKARRTTFSEAASREIVAAVLIGFVLVAPIITAATIWAPVFYNLKPLVLTSKLENFASGTDWTPSPALTKLAFVSPGALRSPETGDRVVAEARRVLEGRFPVAGSRSQTLQLPFDESAVLAGDLSWQLQYSGFRIPSILIAAYRETRDGDFLAAARDFILGWYEFEKTRWMPDGFVWNDHAIASRAMVLTEFWYFYRQSPSFDPELAGRIVRLAAGTAALLANERLYTYATNHGTMQNLALLKLIIFFPEIKEIARYRDLAVERTLAQLPYFVSEEGIVREHSIGYHIFGVRLLHGAKIFLEQLGSRFPPAMTRRLQKAEEFVSLAQRPDGTVPRIGDTLSGSDRSSANEGAGYAPRHAARTIGSAAGTAGFYPKSGYALGWHADAATDWPAMNLAQTTAFWGHFPHRAHKHPDDLSVHLWANGIDWWTSVGYWPYPRDDRDQAIGWAGSNAPHRVGEPTQSLHEPRAEYVSALDKVLFVELTRGSNESFRVNRQIVALPEMVWVIVDSYDDRQAGSARAVWLTDSTNEIEPVGNAGDNRYRVTASGVSDALAVTVLSSAAPTTR